MATNIALRIAGTKERKAGFAPLVNIGVLAGNEGENMDKITLVSEKPAYVLKHASDYILYSLIDRRVKSFDTDAPGVLSIALTIQKGYRLANNKSPYTLLTEVYEKFLTTYMEKKSDGRDEFINTDVNDEVFREILANYPLEAYNSSYIPMSTQGITGILKVESSKLEEFFKDTQYKEFAQFRDIEVGSACTTSVELSNIQIPRAIEYKVFVNDKLQAKTVSNVNDIVEANALNTREYDYTPVTFTLQEMFDAKDGCLEKDGARIVLNAVKSRIDCTLQKVEVVYKIRIDLNCPEHLKSLITQQTRTGELKIEVEGCDRKTQTISYKYLKNQPKITPNKLNGYILTVKSTVRDTERVLLVTVTATKERVAATLGSTGSTAGRSGLNNYSGYSSQKTTSSKLGNPTQDTTDSNNVGEDDNNSESRAKRQIIVFVIGLLFGIILGVTGTLLCQSLCHQEKSDDQQEDSVAQANQAYSGESPAVSIDTTQNREIELAKAKQDSIKQAQEDSAKLANDKIAQEKREKTEKEQLHRTAQDAIIRMINDKKDISEIRKSDSWKQLSYQEQIIVEAIRNLEQYSLEDKKAANDVLKKHKKIKDWQELVAVRKEIIIEQSKNSPKS